MIALPAIVVAATLAATNPPPTPLPTDVPGLLRHMARDDAAGQEAATALVERGRGLVPELLPDLHDPSPRVRYWTAAALCRLADERAYQPLRDALRTDKHPIVRATILWHLQKYGKEEVFDLARQHLNDADPLLRGWAIKVLANGQRRDQLADIVALTTDNAPAVRLDALVAAVQLAGNAQFDLIQRLATTDPDAQVREGALRCLTSLPEKKPAIIAVLIRALADPSPAVQAAAATLLAKGTNQSFGFDPQRPARERSHAIALWQQWYEQNQSRLRWDDKLRRFEPQ